MKKTIIALIVLVVIIALVVLSQPFFVIEEGQQALVLRFNQVVRQEQEAGFYFKAPFVDNVQFYPKKLQRWDNEPKPSNTNEKNLIIVNATARWRIKDPVKFYSVVNSLEEAQRRLDEKFEEATTQTLANNRLAEIVRTSNEINKIATVTEDDLESGVLNDAEAGIEAIQELGNIIVRQEVINKGRDLLEAEILSSQKDEILESFGIEVADYVIREIRYDNTLIPNVYNRMISDRLKVAEAYRSYGEGEKARILGEMEREKLTILSEAGATSEEIRGQADREAAELYSAAYERDPEFFAFWNTLQSYRDTLPEMEKILTTDMEYFRYLYNSDGN